MFYMNHRGFLLANWKSKKSRVTNKTSYKRQADGESTFLPLSRYETSLSTDVCWQQSGGRCRCMPSGHIASDLEDNTEDEEVQRDPRASSASLIEEAQVGFALTSSLYVLISKRITKILVYIKEDSE